MALTVRRSFENRWDPPDEPRRARGARLPVEPARVGPGDRQLRRRQHLRQDARGRPHGPEVNVLWVKGSGSDLATIGPSGFTGLRLDEILPLAERDAMTDQEMVSYLARCQLDPSMPRPSIETLLHAFVPAPARRPHASGRDRSDRRQCRRRAPGARVLRRRRGLDSLPASRVRALQARRAGRRRASRGDGRPARQARPRDVGRHGRGVLRGHARRDQPRRGVRRGARARQPRHSRAQRSSRWTRPPREALLADVLPALRGAVSASGPRILQVDARRRCSSSPADRPRPRSRRWAPHAPTTSCTRGACRSGSSSTRAPRTRRRCRPGWRSACANGRHASSSTSRGIGRKRCSAIRARAWS